jgi:PKD repeat protein
VGTGTVNLNVIPEGPLPGSGPDAGVIVSPATTVNLGTIMSFTSTSTPVDEIVSWEWDFDDGTTATGATATHTYLASGTYKVELLVTDQDDNTDIATQTVTVVELPPTNDNGGEEVNLFDPVAVLSAVPTAGSAPLVVSFDASDSTDPDLAGPLTYAWNFGDGQTGAGALVSHTYSDPGAYTAVLTVTDIGGRTDTATRLISVSGNPTTGLPPVARVTTGLRTGVAPFVVSLDGNLSTGDGLVFEWTIVGGSVNDVMTGAVVNFTFTEAGTYTATLTVTDSEGNTDTSDPVNITVSPTVVPIPTNDNSEEPAPAPVRPPGSTGRPTSLCGAGMLMNSLVSALGLMAMMMGRSRRRRLELEVE